MRRGGPNILLNRNDKKNKKDFNIITFNFTYPSIK